MKLYMTSSPFGFYREDRDTDGFNEANGLVRELRRDLPDQFSCVIICASPQEYQMNDQMRKVFKEKFKQSGLKASCVEICDYRNATAMRAQIHHFDMVILGGGHVPTMHQFLQELRLKKELENFRGVVMGISAGTMNCAKTIYVSPELPGEAADPDFPHFIEGLGLSKYAVLPHYQAVKDDVIDGMRLIEDIVIPDSKEHKIYLLPDGSYILQRGGKEEIRGEAYLAWNGKIVQISGDE